jgi:MULE transposase domain
MQKLKQKKLENPEWYFSSFVEDSTNQLARLFWMNPDQKYFANRFGNIIIIDNGENRTLYSMYLTLVLIIDSNFNSRTIAYSLSTTQNTEAFTWLLQHLEYNLPYPPTAVFSDHEFALEGALESIWPNTFHGLCLWHIEKNLKENLVSILHNNFLKFMDEFWSVYRAGSKDAFQIAWDNMILQWPNVQKYLSLHLFPTHTKWAWAWVGTRFLAGLRTSGRVEAEHRITKELGLGANTSLNQLFEILNSRVEYQKELAELKHYQVFDQSLSKLITKILL